MSREEGAVVAVGVLCAAILFVRALPYDTQVNAVGVVVGLVGGGFLNWWFSRRTSREVRIILRAMALKEEGEEIEFRYNAKGAVVGFHFKRTPVDAVSVSDPSMDRKVIRREDTDPEQPSEPRPDRYGRGADSVSGEWAHTHYAHCPGPGRGRNARRSTGFLVVAEPQPGEIAG
jgi:hypothetical protein